MEKQSRRVRFENFIDYIQKEYRQCVLNGKDYEILEKLSKEYSAQEIKLALDYCKKQKTDSLIYLEKCLINKYYEQEEKNNDPEWMQNPELCKSGPLDEKDKEWCRYFYKKYCDTEEEYQKRLLENGL